LDNLIVRIEKLIWRGRGLARLDSGQVILVDPPVLPDELVQVKIFKKNRDFLQGKVHKIVEPSPIRRLHPCKHGHQCGGCTFGVAPNSQILKIKKQILIDALTRNLKKSLNTNLLDKIELIPSRKSWRYRFRGQIYVHQKKPHFKKLGSNELVRLSDCLLLASPLGRGLNKLASHMPNGRFIVAASPEDGRIAWQGEKTLLDFSLPEFNIKLQLPPHIFFQAHWLQNQTLVSLVVEELRHYTRIADLYAGARNFSLPLARSGHMVLAVEECQDAVRAGELNARKLGLDLVKFRAHDLRKKAPWEKVKNFDPQAVIIDPPRTGSPDLWKKIDYLANVEKMVWISCDVVNTCRDMKRFLNQGWQLGRIYLVDMFPQTWHMEVVFVLVREGR
jgi:23S rRNA (uracil1939-C5)-methyltransferase